MAHAHSKNYVNIRFQIIVIIISSILIGLIIYRPINHFYSIDLEPTVFSVTPSLTQEFKTEPSRVKVGFFIHSFPMFNLNKGEFSITGVIWFIFDPAIISLATLNKFSFDNAEITAQSEPFTRIVGDKVFARYNIKVNFHLPLNYTYFPFDNHRLNLVFKHDLISPTDIKFESASNIFVLNPQIQPPGWQPIDQHIESGFAEAVLDTYDKTNTVYYPIVSFAIDFSRLGIRYALIIFLPLLLIFYLSTFAFSLNPDTYRSSILSLATGGITALLAYRFVIENMSPATGYFTVSDYIFFIFLFTSFINFFMILFISHLSVWVKKVCIIILHSIVVISIAYLLLVWTPT